MKNKKLQNNMLKASAAALTAAGLLLLSLLAFELPAVLIAWGMATTFTAVGLALVDAAYATAKNRKPTPKPAPVRQVAHPSGMTFQ